MFTLLLINKGTLILYYINIWQRFIELLDQEKNIPVDLSSSPKQVLVKSVKSECTEMYLIILKYYLKGADKESKGCWRGSNGSSWEQVWSSNQEPWHAAG